MNIIKEEYEMIRCATADNLSEVVNKYLDLGWVVYGNPFISTNGYLHQAIIRRMEIKNTPD